MKTANVTIGSPLGVNAVFSKQNSTTLGKFCIILRGNCHSLAVFHQLTVYEIVKLTTIYVTPLIFRHPKGFTGIVFSTVKTQ